MVRFEIQYDAETDKDSLVSVAIDAGGVNGVFRAAAEQQDNFIVNPVRRALRAIALEQFGTAGQSQFTEVSVLFDGGALSDMRVHVAYSSCLLYTSDAADD